jgi:phosphoribosylamine--glycine ligase
VDGRVVTDGGRVLGVTALGDTVADAIQAGYAAAGRISWSGMQYRHDIGHRALEREAEGEHGGT